MDDLDFKEENNEVEKEEKNNEDNENKNFERKEILTQAKEKILEKIYRDNDFQTIHRPPKMSMRILLISIVVSIIFGLLAGFFGALFLLTRKEINFPFLKKINFENILPKREITLVTEKSVNVLSEERVSELQEKLKKETVQIFFSKKIDENNILSETRLPRETLGNGVIFTNDGWIITTKNIIGFKNTSYEVATFDKKIYLVKKIFFDDLSGVVFLKIDGNDLPVVSFSDEIIKEGKEILLIDKLLGVSLVEVNTPHFSKINTSEDFIQSTEKFSQFIKISRILDDKFIGSPAFNLSGNLIGFVSADRELLIPVDYFKAISFSLLKNNRIIRPYLGLQYIFLEDLYNQNQNKGVLIWQVLAKSPAELAGLKKGDIIIKVDGYQLSDKDNLTKLVQEKNPGDESEFTILRDSREMVFKAKLSKI